MSNVTDRCSSTILGEPCEKQVERFPRTGLCDSHYYRRQRGSTPMDQKWKLQKASCPDDLGWNLRSDGYLYRAGSGALFGSTSKIVTQLQHRVIMEKNIGRTLYPHENVHHINGIRHDNRIENLELWLVPQAIGRRASDLAQWIVDNYTADELEAMRAG